MTQPGDDTYRPMRPAPPSRRRMPSAPRRARTRRFSVATGVAVAATALAVSAIVNLRHARAAEQASPPRGRFVTVGDVRLHYFERGEGPPLVLIHGNGSMIEDFVTSGLVEMAARHYRVILFDRPGFGHSDRPRSRLWTANAQADLIHRAMQRIGVPRATVLGHSWGAVVATALALRHPDAVQGLVLASGYYYPSARLDSILLAGPAIPVVGDVLRYTVSPVLGRLLWPRILRRLFAPAPVPPKFDAFPRDMSLRPWQIRASAAEAAMLIPTARAARHEYPRLAMPVSIVAGTGDRLIDTDTQSERLHRTIAHSRMHRVAGAGHMVHQTAPHAVMDAIDEVAGIASRANAQFAAEDQRASG